MPFVWCWFCSVERQEARRLMCVCVYCFLFLSFYLFLLFVLVFLILKWKRRTLSSFQCLSFCSATNCQSNNLIKSVRLKRCKNIKTRCQWMALRSPPAYSLVCKIALTSLCLYPSFILFLILTSYDSVSIGCKNINTLDIWIEYIWNKHNKTKQIKKKYR